MNYQDSRKLAPGKLVIASHNKGKIREIAELLGPAGIEPVSAGELGLPEPEETGTTFIANAELKARLAADQRVLGVVHAELRLHAVEVGDQLKFNVAQDCVHQLLLRCC